MQSLSPKQLDFLLNSDAKINILQGAVRSGKTYVSLWRATGQPGQGAIPAATTVCNNTTLGGMGWRVAVVWECAIRTDHLAVVEQLSAWLTSGSDTIQIEALDGVIVQKAIPFATV